MVCESFAIMFKDLSLVVCVAGDFVGVDDAEGCRSEESVIEGEKVRDHTEWANH